MSSRLSVLLFFLPQFLLAQSANRVLDIDDDLIHQTLGRQSGGALTAEGWKTQTAFDYLQYDIPTCAAGEVQFDVTGIEASNEVFPNIGYDKYGKVVPDYENIHYTLFGMFDRDDDNDWYGTLQWHNPYKCVMHLYGYTPGDVYKWGYMKLRLNVAAFNGGYEDDPHAFEDPSTGPFNWQKTHTYHHRLVWGEGHMRWYLDDQLIKEWDYSTFGAEYAPPDHSLRLASGLMSRSGGYAAPIGLVYKNFKFYRYQDVTPPEVVEMEPQPGSADVPLDADILVTFSEPMDAAATEAAFSTLPPVDGQLKWIGNSLYLQKTGLLQSGTIYRVQITAAARDHAGLTLQAPYSRTFTTRSGAAAMVGKYEEFEVTLIGSGIGSGHRYRDVSLKGVFHGPSKTIEIEGFWDGGDIWKVRMAPPEVGSWSYEVTSSEKSLQQRGSFICVESSRHGFIRPNPVRPYSFMYDDGTPWLWKGDTSWRGYTSLVPYEGRWKSYVDLRAQQGYTAMQSIVVSYINGLGFWKNEGGSCFVEGTDAKDYDQLNPGYFHWIDKRLDYALDRGIVPVILFTWAQEYVNFTPRQFERFVHYLVARYAAKNVIWVLCGEYNEITADFGRPTSEFADLGRLVKKLDPYDHPVTLHPTGRTSSDEFGDEEWHDIIMQQTPYSARDIGRDRRHNKPVVNAEPRYFYPLEAGEGANDESRFELWEIVCSGGYYTSGFFATYAPDKGGWDPAALPEEQNWVSFLNRYVTRLPLTEMEPHPEWTSAGQLLAKPGVEYLAYDRGGGVVTIDFSHMSRALPVEWIDPKTGTLQNGGRITGGAPRTLTPPFAGDWALHIGAGVEQDSIPPNPPQALSSPAQTMNSINLLWQPPAAAADGDLAATYQIIRDGTTLATIPATNFQDLGLQESYSYAYEVFAIDDAGNRSAAPARLTVPTQRDTTPPEAIELKLISATELQVVFSEKVDPASAGHAANYRVTPMLAIQSAAAAGDGLSAMLRTAAHAPGQTYILTVANVRDLARTPNEMVARSFSYQFEITLQISELAPASYRLADLSVNDRYYNDRDYLLRQIPPACAGYRWIMTDNDDKTRTDAMWLSFITSMNVSVMVGYDAGLPLPSWLSSWQDVGASIVTSDDAPLKLYQKVLPAGKVVLGGNHGDDSSSMYVVLVKKSDAMDPAAITLSKPQWTPELQLYTGK